MIPEQVIWVFTTAKGHYPGGVFSSPERAEDWIVLHGLTGVLTASPLNQGAFDWALATGTTNLHPELLAQKCRDPAFIGSFSTALQKHYQL